MIIRKTLATVLFILAGTTAAQAMPLQNGDFSAGLDQWTNAGATDAMVEDGAAVLSTQPGDNANPFSAILVQGDDGNFNFPNAFLLPSDIVTLEFDVRAVSSPDFTEAGGSLFTDALTVAVYDALGVGPTDLLFTSGTDFAVTTDWQQVSFDVAALAGNPVALSFALFDESDGADTRFFLDNVGFVPRLVGTVPVPSSLALILLGLVAVRRRR
ncbi:MAG: MYXO-CTERM sorting domain-containing protein [Halioglobus sp.]